MIRAVIFDFGNVICRFDPRIFVERIAPYSTQSRSDLSGVLKNSPDLFIRYESGLITSDDFFDEMCRRCSLSCSQEQFIPAFAAIFSPIPSTFALIRSLKGRYRLGLLSNTSDWHFRYGIKSVAVFPLFDSVSLSFVVHAMKPAEAIYRDALGKLGCSPRECVYVDDIKEFSEAAASLGIHAVHYTDHQALMRSLNDLGVIPGDQSLPR